MLVHVASHGRIEVRDRRAALTAPDLATDVANGLSKPQKTLPPLYFYDDYGSRLFEKICELPEYYITRSESEILQEFAPEIAGHSHGEMCLIELGSGSAIKTKYLIAALLEMQRQLIYRPIDISESALLESAQQLGHDFPHLRILGIIADYETGLKALREAEPSQRLVAFLGSNIGNFEPSQALNLMRQVRSELQAGDFFLVGTDLQKDVAVLEAAYNDCSGITAAFNLNMLRRINRELDADFNLSAFAHSAFYNAAESRIEMHLRSLVAQQVHIGALARTFHFKKGETIHTENSHKYSLGQIEEMCRQTGFRLARHWQDRQKFFSLNLLSPVCDDGR